MSFRALGAVFLVIAGAAIAIAVLRSPDTPSTHGTQAPAPEPRPGRVAAEGRVTTRPGAEVVVGTEYTGKLARVAFVEGQHVRAGDILAEIDSTELRAALAEGQALIVETASEVRLAELNLQRRRELTRDEVLAASELDQAQRDYEMATARLATRMAQADLYRARLAKTRIVAPITGTVIARHVDAGEIIESTEPVATLADLRQLRIDAEADEADAGALAVDASVEITCDAFPGLTWKGRVEEVADPITLRKLKSQDPTRPTDTRILALKVAFLEPTPLKLGASVLMNIARATAPGPEAVAPETR